MPNHPFRRHLRLTVPGLAALLLAAAPPARAQIPQLINYQGRVAVGGVNFDGAGQFKFALVDSGTNTSRQATATATVTSGFVTSVAVNDGGAGYTAASNATVSATSGSGAVLQCVVTSGAISRINIVSPGAGYSGAVTVRIDAPPVNLAYKTYWSNSADVSPADGVPDTAVKLTVTKGLYSILLGDDTLANMIIVPNNVFSHPDVRLRVWFDDGEHGLQLLTPDQRIAAVGYAMMADTAQTAQTAQTVADGAITAAKLASGAVGSAQLASNLTLGGTTRGTFTGSGAGLTGIPASSVTGTIPASQIAAVPAGMVLIPAGAFTMGNVVGSGSDSDITNAAPVSTTGPRSFSASTW